MADGPIGLITEVPDMTKMSKDKFCTLPGQPYIRCTTVHGGHTVVIGPAGMKNKKGELLFPREIPQLFVKEALGKGAITEAQLQRIQAGVYDDDTPAPAILPESRPDSTPEMLPEQRYGLIKRAMLNIILAGKPEDFTQQGIPIVGNSRDGKGLSGVCGFDVSASERDAAFTEVKDSPELQALKK
jgi:hypothetical protein